MAIGSIHVDNLRRFATILCLAFLALLGVRGLLLQIPWNFPQIVDMAISANIPPWVKYLTWFAAAAIPIGMFAEAVANGGGRALLEIKGRDGATILLRQAVIVKIVQERVGELPEVDKLRVKAKAGRKGLRLYIGVAAKAVTTIGALEEAIRARVDQGLREILGIQEIASIQIRLDDVSLSGRATPPGEEPMPPPMPPPRAPLVDRDDAPAQLSAAEAEQSQPEPEPSGGQESEELETIESPDQGEDSNPSAPDAPDVSPENPTERHTESSGDSEQDNP